MEEFYRQKYLKYKIKYNKLRGGEESLEERIKQIPKNFLKQKTIVPPYYTEVKRAEIPDGCESWDTDCENYAPVEYTAQIVLNHDINTPNTWTEGRGWADPKEGIDIPQTNKEGITVRKEIDLSERMRKEKSMEELIQYANTNKFKLRFSHTGALKIDKGYPKNPIGRTGLIGRGSLGNWGPNHAADPVVARLYNGKLQFVLIKRKDNGQWALPGGMVEAGQTISGARTKEFQEEAVSIEGTDIKEFVKKIIKEIKSEMTDNEINILLNTKEKNDEINILLKDRKEQINAQLERIFNSPENIHKVLYSGVVDDPRNTDQSWMETVAMLTFIKTNDANLRLEAGDDAGKAKWCNYNPSLPLFASHQLFIDLAVDYLLKNKLITQENIN